MAAKDWTEVYEPPPPGVEDPAAVRRLQRLAYLLDDRFNLPGTGTRIGLDGIFSIIPGVGDVATGVVTAYIIAEAYRLGVPTSTLARMGWNLGVDVLFGSVPVLGTVFDIYWKANRKNIALLLRHLEERAARGPADATTAAAGVGRRNV
jgi:Domain of unknown function (DUF4112)